MKNNNILNKTPIRAKTSQEILSDEERIVAGKNEINQETKIQENLYGGSCSNTADTGRSIVEMLGILAIAGVISVGGIAGYQYAMNQYRANQIANEINFVRNELQLKILNGHKQLLLGTPYDEGKTQYGEYGFAYECGDGAGEIPTDCQSEDVFTVEIENIPVEICKPLKRMVNNFNNLESIYLNNAEEGECQSGENIFTLTFIREDLIDGTNSEEGEECDRGSCDVKSTTHQIETETQIQSTPRVMSTSTLIATATKNATATATAIVTGTITATYFKCQTDSDCEDIYNSKEYFCITNDNTVKTCKKGTCSGDVCVGNIYFASSEASYFCEALGKRLATKEEWQYANKYSAGPVWVNNGGTIQAWYKCCDANSNVSHYSNTTKTAPLCINTNMTIKRPDDECQTHSDCENIYNSKEYFCITYDNTVKACKKGTCSGDVCVGNIWYFTSSEADYFCEVFGKRLATKEEWQYADKYSGSPVWVNNGGTIQAWYKCCNANSNVSHYSWTTKTAPLCINTNMTIEKPSTKNQLETTGILTTNLTPITSN